MEPFPCLSSLWEMKWKLKKLKKVLKSCARYFGQDLSKKNITRLTLHKGSGEQFFGSDYELKITSSFFECLLWTLHIFPNFSKCDNSFLSCFCLSISWFPTRMQAFHKNLWMWQRINITITSSFLWGAISWWLKFERLNCLIILLLV